MIWAPRRTSCATDLYEVIEARLVDVGGVFNTPTIGGIPWGVVR